MFHNGDRRAVVSKATTQAQYSAVCFDGEDFQEQRVFDTHDAAKDFAEDWVMQW